jgi:hypothetical protein
MARGATADHCTYRCTNAEGSPRPLGADGGSRASWQVANESRSLGRMVRSQHWVVGRAQAHVHVRQLDGRAPHREAILGRRRGWATVGDLRRPIPGMGRLAHLERCSATHHCPYRCGSGERMHVALGADGGSRASLQVANKCPGRLVPVVRSQHWMVEGAQTHRNLRVYAGWSVWASDLGHRRG